MTTTHMKRNLILALAALAAAALVSCSREESPAVAEDQTIQEFTVIDETEQTGAELFNAAVDPIAGIADEEMLAKVREAFQESCTRLEAEADPQTKSVAPLLYRP